MRNRRLYILPVLLSLTLRCHATLVTDVSQFPLGASLINFSQFTTTNIFGPGPVEVGQLVGESVLWSSNYSGSAIFSSSNSSYGLGANGIWSSPMSFAGVNGQPDGQINSMRFDFAGGPVRSVGGLINYVPNNPAAFAFARISALDINGSVIETYNLMSAAPISTPSATNQSAFRGIVHATDDIYAFELSNAEIVVDDLRFARAAPEPTSAALLGLGVLLLAHRRVARFSPSFRACAPVR